MTNIRGKLPVAHLSSLIDHIQHHSSNSTNERTQVFDAFRGLVFSRVRKYCYAGSTNYEDCVQEAYVGLAKAIERFDTSRGLQFSTFATTIVDRRIIDLLTSEHRVNDGPMGRRLIPGEPDEDGNVLELENLAAVESFVAESDWAVDVERIRPRLKSAVRELPTRQLEAVNLFYGEDLQKAAIAVRMNVSRPRVTALLDGAIKGLRRRMEMGS